MPSRRRAPRGTLPRGQRVPEDVLDESVTLEGAVRDHGVVLRPGTLEVHVGATRRLRVERRSPSPAG